jgi:hypothetical protein
MTEKPKIQPGTPYDLDSLSRDRLKKSTPASHGTRVESPYTLRKESSLTMLRSKVEKKEPN